MTSQARGMPSMELSNETKEEIKAEVEESKPKEQQEMFQKPKMEIKSIDALAPLPDKRPTNDETETAKPIEPPKKVVKPKKKLTDKQLEALRKGREKSIATRQANAKAKKEAKQQQNIPAPHQPTQPIDVPQPSQPKVYNQPPPTIDYDKIINGVASRYDNMMKTRADREHKVAEDIGIFEQQIRSEERNKVLDEIDELQKKEAMEKAKETAYNTISKARPAQSQNPYLYAMNMGARNRFKRY